MDRPCCLPCKHLRGSPPRLPTGHTLATSAGTQGSSPYHRRVTVTLHALWGSQHGSAISAGMSRKLALPLWSVVIYFSALLRSPTHPSTPHPCPPHSRWMHCVVLHKEMKNSQTEALFFCQVHKPPNLDALPLLLPFCSRGKHGPSLLPRQDLAEILGVVPLPPIRSHCLGPFSFASSSFS